MNYLLRLLCNRATDGKVAGAVLDIMEQLLQVHEEVASTSGHQLVLRHLNQVLDYIKTRLKSVGNASPPERELNILVQ